jgi:putative ABC transport system permease protein
MNELFGIPLGTLLAVLVVALTLTSGAIAVLALRNPVLVRLGVRNVRRRGGRTALIVVGLMLGTTIVAAALTTGDTMSHTIRSTTIASLGQTDEVISRKGAADDIPGELGEATGRGWFAASEVARIESAVAGSGLTDGVTGAIVEPLSVQAPRTRQSEPSVNLFAADPTRMEGFSRIEDVDGGTLTLADLRPGELYLNEKGAEELDARAGDRLLVHVGAKPASLRIRAVVRFDGTGTADAAFLVPLAVGQRLLGHPDEIRHVLVSNRGGAESGAPLTDDVTRLLEPAAAAAGLEVATSKQDAIEDADLAGSAFMAFFTTFGSFSIAAGVLLIFLIFVMLAAERRGELGIARAIGTRRGHLVQLFTFAGAAYALAAALVGALLGAAVAYGMVLLMAKALGGSGDEDAGFQVEYAVSARSLLIAFTLGVLLTFVVVAVSAWRVSVMTISTAIRNLPEPPGRLGRRQLVVATLFVLFGALLAVAGATGSNATPLMLGCSLVLVGLVPIARRLGVGDRLANTVAGLAVVVLWMLPWSTWEWVFGPLTMDFTTWIVAGLMVVVGSVWTIVYNADLLLGAVTGALGRIRALAPVLRISMAYPLKGRFRTGTTLAMFTLVVFTLVTGSTTNGSFRAAFSSVEQLGGGFDIRSGTGSAAPVDDMRAAIRGAPGLRAADYPAVGSQSLLAVDARQLTAARPPETYVVRGLDDGFLARTTFELGAVARGYADAPAVWRALRTRSGLAVVDSLIVPRRGKFGFNPAPADFALTGFYVDEGKPFAPIPVEVVDKQTGRRTTVTVIGVLADTHPLEMVGISTSQRTLDAAFPGRARPTVHYFDVAPGVDPVAAATRLESAFLASGLEAEAISDVVEENDAAGRTFSRLIQAFMGLGLIVGVAALAVISARAVVERRQQIGVLRAIGFRRGMVQAVFLLESSFVALTAIAVGTALGLLLAWNIVRDSRSLASWQHLELVVPWANLLLVFGVVYAVALAATLAPALRASRIRPAEALRYE